MLLVIEAYELNENRHTNTKNSVLCKYLKRANTTENVGFYEGGEGKAHKDRGLEYFYFRKNTLRELRFEEPYKY